MLLGDSPVVYWRFELDLRYLRSWLGISIGIERVDGMDRGVRLVESDLSGDELFR